MSFQSGAEYTDATELIRAVGRTSQSSASECMSTHEVGIKRKNGPQVVEFAGRPADCLGLTKRWSLYVASTATPGPKLKPRPTCVWCVQSLFTGSVRAVASGAVHSSLRPKPRLEQPALSLSHLTWSLGTSTTAIRTCHQTTSFPV